MIATELINPKSIVVIGGTDNLNSPGGKILDNLIAHRFKGKLFVVNQKKDKVRGLPTYNNINDLPTVDLAIIAIAARFVEEIVKILTEQKNTKGFIIISAGFSDENEAGKKLEKRIVAQIKKHQGTLLGPNNIGLINQNYAGVFTSPVPKLDPKGVDLISGSGATAVFIIEAAMQIGLSFNSVWTVGNSAQIGVEEVLEFLDNTHTKKSPKTKLLYIESIKKPMKFLRHAQSLIEKGCRIAAVKAGSSDAGSRAASSHTGALASADVAVDALFEKAGIIRAYGRNELIYLGGIMSYDLPKKNKMAIVTHAGGPAVMLTDTFEKNNIIVPEIKGNVADELLKKLYPGSSTSNPIDFLATGTAQHLDDILETVENKFDEIDAVSVIFGSPGLFEVYDVYDVLAKHIKKNKKPIYPILPSVVNVKNEIDYFQQKGLVSFPDEVLFGNAFAKVFHAAKPSEQPTEKLIDTNALKPIILEEEKGYLSPEKTSILLKTAGIPMVDDGTFIRVKDAVDFAKNKYPVVMKVVGPIHKSDVGGVRLNIRNENELKTNFKELMQIDKSSAVLIQTQKKGIELFVGAKKEESFGHLILFGMGGIYIEVLKDYRSILTPVTPNEISKQLKLLQSYPILKGTRGKAGIDIKKYIDIIVRISELVEALPEISELDLNPILANENDFFVVDARLKIR